MYSNLQTNSSQSRKMNIKNGLRQQAIIHIGKNASLKLPPLQKWLTERAISWNTRSTLPGTLPGNNFLENLSLFVKNCKKYIWNTINIARNIAEQMNLYTSWYYHSYKSFKLLASLSDLPLLGWGFHHLILLEFFLIISCKKIPPDTVSIKTLLPLSYSLTNVHFCY